jgi:hypothetical protein
MPYEGRPGAYWALLGSEVELRRTEYDVESAAAVIRAAEGGAMNEQQATWLLDPPDPEEATAFFEAQRGA